MINAHVVLDREFVLGPVPRRLFGSFVEHMGRCVYTGIYEPGHPEADAGGLRTDVLELTRQMGVSVVRYPGGNFVSGHRWEDGVGPDRPCRLDGAWHSVESNEFGLGELVDWARAADVEVMQAVNLGTRGVQAARELVEYANHPGGTALSDLRRAHGYDDPFGIRLWCLGNEMDGPWQIGHKTAAEYGRLAAETAKAMKMVDPSIEVVACGSSNMGMATFGAWEHTVLSSCYEHVDYISLHVYYRLDGPGDAAAASFLGCATQMDTFIESVVCLADAVRATGRHANRVDLSFDEWNVWHFGRDGDDQPEAVAARPEWSQAPRLIEDTYTVTDAVVVATMMHSLLRHGDRVRIANQAQLVNVIAPIRAEPGGPAWRQTTYWPFARMAALASGQILRASTTCPTYPTEQYGDVPTVDVVATWDAASGQITVFVANRGLEVPANLDVSLRGWHLADLVSAEVLAAPDGGDRSAANTHEAPDTVTMRTLHHVEVRGGRIEALLPPLSWSVLQIEATAC
ncbi:MAG: alpha-N-arabinofuranosidase [Cellulomonas sp.]